MLERLAPYRRWLRDGRVKGASALTASAAASSVISLIALPFITTIYSPATYAQYAIVLAVSTLLGTVISGRFEMASVTVPHDAGNEPTAWKLCRLAIRTSIIATLSLQVISLIFVVVSSPADSWRILIVPPLALAGALAIVQDLLDIRLANYTTNAWLRASQAVMISGGAIALGLLWPSAIMLLIPLIASFVPRMVRLSWLMTHAPGESNLTYRQIAHTYRRFPQFQTVSDLTNGLSVSIFVFILAWAYGDVTTGLFAVAIRFTLFPKTVVFGPVNTVYFREAAKVAGDKIHSWRLYLKMMTIYVIGGILSSIAIVAILPLLMTFLGPEWSSARSMILATIPMGLSLIIGAPASYALVTLQCQRQLLGWRLVMVIAPALVIVVAAALAYQSEVAVLGASSALLAVTIGYVLYAAHMLRVGAAPQQSPVDLGTVYDSTSSCCPTGDVSKNDEGRANAPSG